MKTMTKLWIGLGVLVLLSPLGLILPAKFGAGSAWGEWSAEEMQKLVGYMPAGMKQLSGRWAAPMPDYTLQGHGHNISYIFSGIIGVALVVLFTLLIGRLIAHRENSDHS